MRAGILSVAEDWFHLIVVPRPEDRTALSWLNAPILLLPFMPLLAVAYLARRPQTRLLRALCLPLVLMGTTRIFFAYYFSTPGANEYNWAMGLLGLYCLARAVELCFAPNGRLKIGESADEIGRVATPAIERENVKTGKLAANGHTPARTSSKYTSSPLLKGLFDAIELLCAVRGIGWDFGTGTGLYIPPPNRPQERRAFKWTALFMAFVSFFALDALESFLKLWPGVQEPTGGTIFMDTLPPTFIQSLPFYPSCIPLTAKTPTHLTTWQKYALSTALHSATGFAFVAGFNMCYDLFSLFGVIILGHLPSSWPPCWDAPWLSTSLHELWARRWHQFLRQTFLVMGGFPLSFVFTLIGVPGGARLGFVIGSFAASGAFHEFGMYAMGRGLDSRVFIFFFSQGLLVIGEHFWRKVTRRRVGGIWGHAWVLAVIFIGAQPLVDSWHMRGLGGGWIIPPFISPTRLLLWPAVRTTLGFLAC